MADTERRIFHIHPWEDKNSRYGKHKTQVERNTTVETLGIFDNVSIKRYVTVPESGWKAAVTENWRPSVFNTRGGVLLVGKQIPDTTYSADLRGWRNLPLHPGSLLGVGWSGFSGWTRDYVRAERWLAWQGRRLKARLSGK